VAERQLPDAPSDSVFVLLDDVPALCVAGDDDAQGKRVSEGLDDFASLAPRLVVKHTVVVVAVEPHPMSIRRGLIDSLHHLRTSVHLFMGAELVPLVGMVL